MIKKIKKEFARFIKKQHSKLYGNYFPVPFLCSWNDVWKNYYIDNKNNINAKLNLLKRNLDKDSKEVIDLVYHRYMFLNPWMEYKDCYLMDYSYLYTPEELREQDLSLNFSKSDFKLPDGYNHSFSVYQYDSGLCFLDKSVLNQIRNKDVIDGGAFIGDSALIFNKYDPSKIFCFEPNSNNFKDLKKTIELNNLEQVIVPIEKGLGDIEREIQLYGGGIDSSVISNGSQLCSTIFIESIDNFVENNDVNPGLIKLDVEGFELETVKGAIKTIKKYKPILIISLYHQPKDFFEIKPLIEELSLGYEFLVRKIDPKHPTVETILIGYVK